VSWPSSCTRVWTAWCGQPTAWAGPLGGATVHIYGGSYSDTDLRWWAARIQEWADQGRDVYVYFNNDGHGHAVYNAETLKGLIGH
jgi:uncharacterized protein YecE (DUF72 family)